MSSARSSRSSAGARPTKSSTSGRMPAFHASMNWLRMRSRSGVTEDPLELQHAAPPPLVDVLRGDVQALCDLVACELLDVRHVEHLLVAGVGDLGDRPDEQVVGLLTAVLVGERLLGELLALARVAGDGRVVRAPVVAVGVARVETAGRVLVVAELLAPVVQAGVLDALRERGAELAERALAELRAHRDHAQVGLLSGVGDLVDGEPTAALEAERLDEARDAVEVAERELLPQREGTVELPAVAVVAELPEDLLLAKMSLGGADASESSRVGAI